MLAEKFSCALLKSCRILADTTSAMSDQKQKRIAVLLDRIQKMEGHMSRLEANAQRFNPLGRNDGPQWRMAVILHRRAHEELERLEMGSDVCAVCHEGITDCLCL